MRRLMLASGLLAILGLFMPTQSYAQQSVNFYFGGIHTPDYHGREFTDVLSNNLDFLSFDIHEFAGPTVGGEYLVGLGDYLDAGLGVGYYAQTVPSVYTNYVNSNGSEIRQDLRLRMTPFTATVRLLPFGRSDAIQPYIGAGVAIINWKYSESGQFVDFTDGSIFTDSYVATGTSTGPLVLGGLRIPVGRWAFGGEVRWQDAKGDLPASLGFAGSTIDLSGWNYLATIHVTF